MRRFFASWGVVCILVASSASRVEAAESAEDTDALIARGLTMRRAHDNEGARELFFSAYQRGQLPRIGAQLALAEQALGHWVMAEATLRSALESTSDSWVNRNRETLEHSLSVMRAHVGSVIVSSNRVPTRVLLDGVVLEPIALEQPFNVAAGALLLRVESGDTTPVEVSLKVEPQRTSHVVMQFAAKNAGEVPSERSVAPPSEPARPTPIMYWSAGAAVVGAVAGLTIGALYGIEALTDKASRDAHCSGGRCDSVGIDMDTKARSAAIVSTVGAGAGIASGVVAAWLLGYAIPAARSVAVAPTMNGRSLGMAIWSSW